ncbi:MAG: DEAD/DEAH box helicase family protein [Alsobacter sp.]
MALREEEARTSGVGLGASSAAPLRREPPSQSSPLPRVPGAGGPSGPRRSHPMRPTLRPYQEAALIRLRDIAGEPGARRVLFQAPTGSGKTVMGAKLAAAMLAIEPGRKIAFVVPNLSLIDQAIAALEREGLGPTIGVIQSKHPRTRPNGLVQVCSVQTLDRRGPPEGVRVAIIDEAHLEFQATTRWLAADPDLFAFGLSATPWTEGLRKTWKHVIRVSTMHELTKMGALVRTKIFAPSAPNLAGVRIVAGDYDRAHLARICSTHENVAAVVAAWQARGEGRPTLAFAVDLAHARTIENAFNAAGIPTVLIEGATAKEERETAIENLRAGRLSIIVSVATLTTGFDLPECSCLLVARPTQSEVLHVQIVGRGLRPAPNKTNCVVIDVAGNTFRHGSAMEVDAADRDADGQRRPKGRPPIPIACSACKALHSPLSSRCPHCGYARPEGPLRLPARISRNKLPPNASREQRLYSELLGYARSKHYSDGWARNAMKDFHGKVPSDLLHVPIPPGQETIGRILKRDREWREAVAWRNRPR